MGKFGHGGNESGLASSTPNNHPILNIATNGATTTVGFFTATTTGLYAGQGVSLSSATNLVIFGEGDATTSIAVPHGSLCVDNDGWCSAATSTILGRITGNQVGAGGSDVAEMYNSDETLSPGDIVGVATHGKVKLAKQNSSGIGVVSTNPGFVLGSGPDYDGGGYPIALAGRVPVNVNNEQGDIKAGDLITLSSVPGFGMKALPGQSVIAVALDDISFSSSSSGQVLGFIDKSGRQGGLTSLDMKSVGTTTPGLDTIKQLEPVSFNYSNGSTTKYGFVPETVAALNPNLVNIDENGQVNGINYDQMMPVVVSSIKDLDLKVESIDQRLTHLEELLGTSTQTSGGSGLNMDSILLALENLGVKIQNGIAYLKNVFVENLTIGTSTKPSGITIYDEVTGDPYCLKMRNGAMVSLPGDCSTATSTPATASSTPSDITSPVISINGDNPAQVTYSSIYNDLGASVTDTNADGSVNNNLGMHFNVDGVDMQSVTLDTSIGSTTPEATTTHTITYGAVDSAGNWGYATRTVNVIGQ